MAPDKIFSNRNTIVFASIVFLVYIVYRIALIFYPTQDAGGVEGNVVYFIQRILDGQSFYTDPEKSPYAIAQYSPIYYYLVSSVAKISGVGADNLLALFAVNRGVSLFFNLGYIFIVYLIARRIFSMSVSSSYVAAVLSFIFFEITSYARPDSLNHFFFLLTLYCFMLSIKWEEDKRRGIHKLIILTAVFAAIALFSKQTSFILPIIIGLWLLVQQKYKNLLLFAGTYLITVSFFVLMLDKIVGFQLFYKNVVLGINNGISLWWFRDAILNPFYLKFGMLFVCAFIVILFFLQKETRPLLRFSKAALILLFCLLNLIALKNGANPGYLTEWWTIIIILTAFYAEKIYRNNSNLRSGIMVALLWFILIIHPVSIAESIYKTISPSRRALALTGFNNEKALADKLQKSFLGNESFAVFLNFYTPDNYMSNLLFRQAVAPQMDIITIASYPQKKYDYSDFEKSLVDGRIKWMLMRTTGPQKLFFNIKLDRFELIETMNGFNLYQYKR